MRQVELAQNNRRIESQLFFLSTVTNSKDAGAADSVSFVSDWTHLICAADAAVTRAGFTDHIFNPGGVCEAGSQIKSR